MNRELSSPDILLCTGFSNEPLSQDRRFSRGYHPAHNIAAEDVHDHIQVKVSPLYRTEKFGDVPRPNLVRGCSQKLRLMIPRMTQLVSTLLDLLVLFEDAIHRPYRTMVLAFVQKSCIDLIGCLVHKSVGVEDIKYFLPFVGRQ